MRWMLLPWGLLALPPSDNLVKLESVNTPIIIKGQLVLRNTHMHDEFETDEFFTQQADDETEETETTELEEADAELEGEDEEESDDPESDFH